MIRRRQVMQQDSLRRIDKTAEIEVYRPEPKDHSGDDFGWYFGYDFVEEMSELILETHYQCLPFPGSWANQPYKFRQDFYQYMRFRNRSTWHHERVKNPPSTNSF
jgi:hypothetical protein